MKIKEILKIGNELLIKNEIEDSFLKSKILLAHVLKVSKEYLIIHDDQEILDEQKEIYINGIRRIVNGEPLQYITNKSEFMGLDFYVDKNVLIPQPDTEILVENVIEIANNLNKKNIKILDLCTGSGAIGVSLGKNLQKAKIFASDISTAAIEVAKRNSESNNVEVEFIKSDLFEGINDKFDIIVSNPPYIETAVIEGLSKEVKNEPYIALDGGKDGLDFYKKIIAEAPKYLAENGYLAVEIGYNQKEAVEKLLITHNYKNIYSKKDLAGLDRIVVAQKG